MFGNWINVWDLQRVMRNASPGRLWRVLGHAARRGTARTVGAYTETVRHPDQWWDVPAVQRRWNELITGDAELGFRHWVAREYLAPRGGSLVGLSVACGTGHRELLWARTGQFTVLHGYDLTPASIAQANAAAHAAGLDGCLTFRVGDVRTLELAAADRYDVIFGEHALHHLSPLREILADLDRNLKPDGLLVVDEFVGPRRFQWTRAQLAEINRLLQTLPEHLRRRTDGRIKRRVIRPSKLSMIHIDPSEAIESDRILPELEARFTRVTLRPYGGAILHLLLSGIAHHFCGDDPEAADWLQRLCAEEDRLMAEGVVASDFVAGVYRKRVS
ncbi:MAG: methyltransferase domain-containing protein [Planctomycetes bacterium]|nr:methyltransferase domain-containing protein [Planctomycetota bacterium]MCB9869545.1 methyltransferase domain-containing protein [Planctomycetota bacterium]MCB9889932.1 methyltransferase domain-containing protein [Planctomycetota bacterium]